MRRALSTLKALATYAMRERRGVDLCIFDGMPALLLRGDAAYDRLPHSARAAWLGAASGARPRRRGGSPRRVGRDRVNADQTEV